jgi:cytosine/adenosine deaminase-related metal-dependent hydrolase
VFRESCEILADVAEELGQRALIGKVCMNMASPEVSEKSQSQESSLENTPECLIMTEQFVRNILDRKVSERSYS